jgi:hypothetical protein
MGIDWGFREDGEASQDRALAVGNFAHEHTSLYRAQGDPTFYADDSQRLGVAAPTRLPLTFGLILLDYDLDGRLDMLQVNGHVESDIDRIDPGQHHRQPAQLFWNTGGSPLLEQVPDGAVGNLARPLVGRGAAYADMDDDGDLDVVVTQTGDAPVLLRNDLETGGHWLRLRLVGRPPNRNALGARVELVAGDRAQRRQVMPARSYLSQMELPLTFGLGEAERVDRLEVTWPDGARELFPVPGVDRMLTLERGRGGPPPGETADSTAERPPAGTEG